MSIYILIDYVETCKTNDEIPTFEGLRIHKLLFWK